MKMRHDPCPDCGVVLQPHTPGCLTEAVDLGKLTPRERQVMIVERQIDAESRDNFKDFRAMVEGKLLAGRPGPEAVRLSPADYRKIADEATCVVGAPVPADQGRLTYMGMKLIVDDSLAPGEIQVSPRRATPASWPELPVSRVIPASEWSDDPTARWDRWRASAHPHTFIVNTVT